MVRNTAEPSKLKAETMVLQPRIKRWFTFSCWQHKKSKTARKKARESLCILKFFNQKPTNFRIYLTQISQSAICSLSGFVFAQGKLHKAFCVPKTYPVKLCMNSFATTSIALARKFQEIQKLLILTSGNKRWLLSLESVRLLGCFIRFVGHQNWPNRGSYWMRQIDPQLVSIRYIIRVTFTYYIHK